MRYYLVSYYKGGDLFATKIKAFDPIGAIRQVTKAEKIHTQAIVHVSILR